jgi:type I restriction enzyme S subunit
MRILNDLEVNLPDIKIQNDISKILSDLDDKIKTNQQMNRTLEAVGRSVFKRWFVDFEFPNEEGKPYKSSGGKMEDSELGEIPKGWIVGTLGDIANKITIPVASKEKLSYNKYVSLDDMPREQIFLDRFSSVDKVDSSMIRFEEGDILFGAMRPYFHKVCIAPFVGITRTTTFVIRAKDKAYQNFLTFLCFQKSTVDYVDSTSVGSTIPYAVFEALENMPIIIPQNEAVLKYQEFVKTLIDKAHVNFRENLILSQIRDSLLPKLMSGKIRVPINIEKVEAS